jgi:tripartite-type tricarboxylate transporter receptor subunit TctC
VKAVLFFVLISQSIAAFSQDYPSRPVRLLVGFPPGGAMDSVARVIAPKLGASLGQQFVVDNRPGAAGAIAAGALVASPADGYALLLAESGALIVPAVNSKAGYDPVKQFAPVAGVCSLPLAIVVSPGFPATSARELIAALKASPGKYSYASPGIGTLQHLAFELFKRSAGVDAVHVPYKGASAMLPDLISGQVEVGAISATVAIAQARAGKIRVIAVTSARRLPTASDVPALAETLPGFDASPNVFLVAPAGTPAAVVARLAEAVAGVLAEKDVQDSFAKQGATATPIRPDELGRAIAAESARWAGVVRDAGIKAE